MTRGIDARQTSSMPAFKQILCRALLKSLRQAHTGPTRRLTVAYIIKWADAEIVWKPVILPPASPCFFLHFLAAAEAEYFSQDVLSVLFFTMAL